MIRVAYLVGIDLPGRPGTCDADVAQISKILHHQYGFEVYAYTSDGSRLGAGTRRNHRARLRGFTKLRFEALLRSIARTPRRHSPKEALFYFAGHGINMGPEAENKGGLVPSDGNPLDPHSLIGLSTILDAFAPKNEHQWSPPHLLLMLDCCFATTQRLGNGRQRFVENVQLNWGHFERFQDEIARQVLTSSRYRPAPATRPGGSTHSPFAFGIIEGLGKARATKHAPCLGKTISITQLHSFLETYARRDELLDSGLEPQLWSLEGHGEGEFIFKPGYWDPTDPEEFVVQTGLDASISIVPKGGNPYKGLQYYTEKDGINFLGRTQEINKLIAELNRLLDLQAISNPAEQPGPPPSSLPLLVLSADSGVGKSSLLHAGLIPTLKKGHHWSCGKVTEIQGSKGQLQVLFAQLQDTLQEAQAERSPRRHLLVWDQFERLSNPELPLGDIPDLLRHIRHVLTQPPHNMVLLIGIRSDFQYLLQAEEILMKPRLPKDAPTGSLSGSQPRIRTDPRYHIMELQEIEPSALKDVICLPAYRDAVFFESMATVERMIAEMKGYPKALGILNLMLSDMYNNALTATEGKSRIMQLEASTATVNIRDYLIDRLETIYQNLADEQERNSMFQMFLRLVTEFDSKFVRRIAFNWEFIFEDAAETARMVRIRRILTSAGFLLKPEPEDQHEFVVNPKNKVELAHDILADSWPLFRVWIDHHAKQFQAFQRLMALTRQFHAGDITGMDRKELRTLEMVLGLRKTKWPTWMALFKTRKPPNRTLE